MWVKRRPLHFQLLFMANLTFDSIWLARRDVSEEFIQGLDFLTDTVMVVTYCFLASPPGFFFHLVRSLFGQHWTASLLLGNWQHPLVAITENLRTFLVSTHPSQGPLFSPLLYIPTYSLHNATVTQIALFLFSYSLPFPLSLSLHSICKQRGYWYRVPKAGYEPSKYFQAILSGLGARVRIRVWCYFSSHQFVFFFCCCLGFSHSVIWAVGFKIWSRSCFVVMCLWEAHWALWP